PDSPDPSDPSDFGDDGFAGSQSTVSAALSSNIGSIAEYELSQGNLAAAAAAEKGFQQAVEVANSTPTAGTGTAVLDGAKFDQQVITWSLANTQGTQAAQFSSYMGSADESVVQAAFDTWASATPGLTFEEVSDSAQSDIRVGFGDFNTATTAVIGYTSYQANGSQIAPDAIVRVEDSAQDALTTGADGQQTYAGTDATLSQVLLHEIGHALGLGDNADQNSVMNYQLTSSNQTLDSTDLVGIGSLYGSGATTSPVGSSGVSQLIQAMSTFNADAGVADTALLPATLLTSNITLVASSRAA
ncbi:matrixin family metalloprotease, partial [Pseudomonas sp. 10S4]